MIESRTPKQGKKYLLVPIPKNPYFRIGPKKWQDWYQQVKKTIILARQIKSEGGEVIITLISNFQPAGKFSEIDIYTKAFHELAPGLDINLYRETNDTFGQVERSFRLRQEFNAELIFISTWMHYLRVLYLAHGRRAQHCGIVGIPQPIFVFIDPICLIFQPLTDIFGLSNLFRGIIINQREKGKIL